MDLAEQLASGAARSGRPDVLAALSDGESLATTISPATLFDTFAYESVRGAAALGDALEVVARPGDPLPAALEVGDLLIRRALGEGRLAHVAVVASARPRSRYQLLQGEMVGEVDSPGLFLHVVETWPHPHTRAEGFARQISRDGSHVSPDSLLLRWRGPASSPSEEAPTATLSPQPTPGRYYQIQRGNTLLGITGRAYGVPAGQQRLQLARLVNDHPFNLRLRRPNPVNLFPTGIISFFPRFADAQAQLAARGGSPPSGRHYAVIFIPTRPTGSARLTLGVEGRPVATEEVGEGAAMSLRLGVGDQRVLTAIADPLPSRNFTWTSASPQLLSVAPLGTPDSHPSRARVRALRPGQTTVSVRYLAQNGSTGTGTFTLVVAPAPAASITLSRPATHTIWAMLHESEEDDLLTRDISQGEALWTSVVASGDLTVTHGALENGGGDRTGPRGTRVRVGERGLLVEGQVDAGATGVRIQVRRGGVAIPLRTTATATTSSPHLDATLVAPAAGATTRGFSATVFLEDPSSRLGRVEVQAESVGLASNVTATADVLLVGVQIALVDDHRANTDGRSRGPVPTEADERFVVDFLDSPQSSLRAISGQTRARRMIVYDIPHRMRPLSAATPTPVRTPEMPMWMAELQLVGIDGAALAAFLGRRAAVAQSLAIVAQWQLETAWDGPNSGHTERPYRYALSRAATTTATLSLTPTGALANLQPTGEVTNALMPAPTAPTFPVAGRRVPQVLVQGVTRGWGRRSTATARPTVLIEHQPLLVDDTGREIMRGGDGKLSITSLTIDGAAVHPGIVGTAAPPANTPIAMVPTFRVRGLNIPETDRRPLVDAVVQDFVNAHAADLWVAALPLATWQETMWRVLQVESIGGNHFDNRSAGRQKFDGRRFGTEPEMPIFGPPAGYGWGQLDSPAVGDDEAWSFLDNARDAVRRLIGGKARAAFRALSTHFPTPINRRSQAVLQRETVRRYNGGREFEFQGGTFVISPSLAQRNRAGNPNPRLNYPNRVLGTRIRYFDGAGATATFPWPIAFGEGDFGPGL